MKRTLIAICSLLTCLYGSAQEQQHTEDLPDYSYCGYRMSAEALPDVAVKVFVSHKDGEWSLYCEESKEMQLFPGWYALYENARLGDKLLRDEVANISFDDILEITSKTDVFQTDWELEAP